MICSYQSRPEIIVISSVYFDKSISVSDQCKHSIKFAVFQGLDKLVFKDRKEFTGSIFDQLSDAFKTINFYNSTKAAMLGASQPRNEKLANLFYRMKLIEAYGTGISKIISCYKGLPVQPTFENVEGAFRVTLPNIHAQSLSLAEEKYLPVLRLFEKQKEITRSDVEKALGVGTTQAVNTLKEMISKALISKVGSGRLTRYIVK